MLLIVENIVDILRKVGIRIVRFVVETMFENGLVGVFDTESQRMLQSLREVGVGTFAGDPDGERKRQPRGLFPLGGQVVRVCETSFVVEDLVADQQEGIAGRACPSCA